MKKGSLKLMKKINQKTILRLIHDRGAISRAKIAEIADLSPSTVSNSVNELLELGLINEREKGKSRGGRRPILLELNSSGFFVVGFEWGITTIRSVLMNLDKKVISKKTVNVINKKPQFFIDKTVDIIKAFAEELNALNKIFGVGIGIHGLVDTDKGISLYAPHFNWHDIEIKKQIEQKVDYPVIIDNDVRMMAYAEKWEGKDDFIFIYTGYGIGSAIVLDGNLLHGKNWSAGEFGHMTIKEDGPDCICGDKGCLNALISVKNLVKKYYDNLPEELGHEEIEKRWNNLVLDAKSGKKAAKKIFEDVGKYLGIAIANVINLLDPQHIIIGGVYTSAEDILYPIIKKEVEKHALKQALKNVKITSTSFGENIGSIGAGNRLIEEIFTLEDDESLVI